MFMTEPIESNKKDVERLTSKHRQALTDYCKCTSVTHFKEQSLVDENRQVSSLTDVNSLLHQYPLKGVLFSKQIISN